MEPKNNDFSKWLIENNYTCEEFSKKAKISYFTAQRWRHGAIPRKFMALAMRKVFPTCPLFENKERR